MFKKIVLISIIDKTQIIMVTLIEVVTVFVVVLTVIYNSDV